jgi:hypothetical protein
MAADPIVRFASIAKLITAAAVIARMASPRCACPRAMRPRDIPDRVQPRVEFAEFLDIEHPFE